MTANELADELQKMFVGEEYDRLIHEIPDLLRQQAQEIEALKKENENRESAIYATGYWKGIEYKKMRELTEEEIDKIIKQHDWYSKTWVNMVRSIESAILKKANEK